MSYYLASSYTKLLLMLGLPKRRDTIEGRT